MIRLVPPRRRCRTRAARGEDGFILLESIVAISLITVILAALGQMTLTSISATSQLRARQGATQLATSAMTAIDSVPATDLLTGRDLTSVTNQLGRGNQNDTVRAALSTMDQAIDTTPLPTHVTVPTGTLLQTLNSVAYSVDTYIGTCFVPKTTLLNTLATCTKAPSVLGQGLTYYRVVVAVTWQNRGCSSNTTCTFVTSSLINFDTDPVFNTNRSTPPSTPVVTSPGNQISSVTGPVSLQLTVNSGTGVPPLTWLVTAGALPVGLTLSGDGLVSGTPTTTQPATPVTVTVTDAFGRTAATTFNWTVLAAPTVTTPTARTSPAGAATSVAITSTCANSPCTFVMANAPAGLSINANTGVISGTPTTVGTYPSVTVTVTDAASASATTAPFSWTITASSPPSVTSPGTQNLTVGSTANIAVPYTCPTPNCTITLTNGIPGLVLSNTTPITGATPETASKFTTPGSVDTTGTTNLSVGKTATQSSTNFNGYPSRAVDGNTDGVFNDNSVTHSDFETQPWWQVDLGSASLVRAVKIWNRTDCCDTRLSNFYVFTSPTDMTGKTAAQLLADPTVAVQRVNGLAGQPNITVPDQAAGRYVRIQLAGFNGTDALSLAEVQVLGGPDTGTSVNVSATSGTVYVTGVVPASAVPTGTSKAYTPTLAITDANAVSRSTTAGTWTAYKAPTVTSPGAQNLTVASTARIPIPYTCPAATCTISLNGGIPGLTLTTTDPAAAQSGSTQFTSPSPVDITGTTNLALNKPATQSSTVLSAPASRAVDGNTDGVFNDGSVSHTNNDSQSWWQVDLGSASLVRAVRIWNRTDCCDTRLSNFYVFTSATDMSARTAASLLADPAVTVQRVSGLSGQPTITVPTQSSARYVRIQLSTNEYLHLAEVQVFGSVDTGTSVTVGAASGTVYATGTIPAGAVPSGTSKAYTPSVAITDNNAASVSAAVGTWTAYTAPTLASLGARSMAVQTSPNVPVAYTCPNAPCTLALTGPPTGLGLSATSGGTSTNNATTLTVTATSGTVYVNGLVNNSAVPSGTSKVYSPTLTITDQSAASTTASGSWTAVNNPPVLTNPGTQTARTGQNVSLQLSTTCPNGGCTNWAAAVQVGGNPTWYAASISSSGLLSSSNVQAGSYYVRITVTDQLGQSDTEYFTLNVVN